MSNSTMWGGPRPGSGRPRKCEALKSRTIGFSLYPDEIEMIDDFANEHGITRSRALRTLLGIIQLDGSPTQRLPREAGTDLASLFSKPS